MKSILSNERRCYICGRTDTLHKHHVYPGYGNRQRSENNGCWVYLCAFHHTGERGVHYKQSLDLRLRRECQRAYEKNHSREEFIATFGQSYLLED